MHIGIFKKCFRILHLGSEYQMDIQAQIPAALATIHNYIRIHDHEEGDLLENLEDFNDCYRHPFDTPG